MATQDRLGFLLASSALIGRTLIPRNYDPEINSRLVELSATHDLITVGSLLDKGELVVGTGQEIGKMAYGTGVIPYVRTSDLASWEVKADPKQGVSEEIYAEYSSRQDVQPWDVLFVKDGTYLVGTVAAVTPADGRLLIQSHILRFRCTAHSTVTAPLLLAALNSPIVRRQVRSKQFTADIIDTIGDRYRDLALPIPRNARARQTLAAEIQETVEERSSLKELIRKIPLLMQGTIRSLADPLPEVEDQDAIRRIGFVIPTRKLAGSVLIPRYYDPGPEMDLASLSATHVLPSIGELVKNGQLAFATGIEPGKMAYGAGAVPFIRTSDISNWELKADPKQGVSEDLYRRTKAKLDVQAEDLLLVRDGTYLVGSSCILTTDDTKIVYCGGLYKIRVVDKQKIDPYLLLAGLNTPVVRQQMRAKQFTRDIIDTIGKRIFEVRIPIPRDSQRASAVTRLARETVERRAVLRDRLKGIASRIEGLGYTVEVEPTELGSEDLVT